MSSLKESIKDIFHRGNKYTTMAIRSLHSGRTSVVAFFIVQIMLKNQWERKSLIMGLCLP